MMDGEDILAGEYRKSPAFAGYHISASAGHMQRCIEDGFMRLKMMIQLWLLQVCLEILSIFMHLKMEMEEFVS